MTIPANKPRVTAISEGVMLGSILITELTTELTNKDTVAKRELSKSMLCWMFVLMYCAAYIWVQY